MAGLKYPYTCELIDAQIGKTRAKMFESVSDFFDDFKIQASVREKLEGTEILYSAMSDFFEKTREINIDMRGAATDQIIELDLENLELRAQNYLLKQKIKKMEKMMEKEVVIV